MEEFRKELEKYVKQTTKLQNENKQLNSQIFELKQRLLENEQNHNLNSENLRKQYVSELDIAKESWRNQAIKYGHQQKLLGREELLYNNNNNNKGNNNNINNVQYNNSTSITSRSYQSDLLSCAALVNSCHFTVLLRDFDISDQHLGVFNSTTVNINLNGCYILMSKSGDKLHITDNIVLLPKTQLSIWWSNTHIENDTNNTNTNNSIVKHSIYNINYLRNSISNDNSNNNLSLFWNRNIPNHHNNNSTPSLSLFEVAELFDATNRKICHVITNQFMFSIYYSYPLHNNSYLLTHNNDNNDNNNNTNQFVEDVDILLMDYNSDILYKLDRYIKRNMGNINMCTYNQNQNGNNHINNNNNNNNLPLSSYHMISNRIEVEEILKYQYFTIENNSSNYTIDLSSKCELHFIFNDGIKNKENISFEIEQTINLLPNHNMIITDNINQLSDNIKNNPLNIIIELSYCKTILSKLQSLCNVLNITCNNNNNNSNNNISNYYLDIPICYCTLVDQYQNILYCSIISKNVNVKDTIYAGNIKIGSNKHPLQNHIVFNNNQKNINSRTNYNLYSATNSALNSVTNSVANSVVNSVTNSPDLNDYDKISINNNNSSSTSIFSTSNFSTTINNRKRKLSEDTDSDNENDNNNNDNNNEDNLVSNKKSKAISYKIGSIISKIFGGSNTAE